MSCVGELWIVTARTELVEGTIEPGGGVDVGGVPAPPPTHTGTTNKKTSPKRSDVTLDDSADLRATVATTASKVDALFTMLQDSLRARDAQLQAPKSDGKKATITATKPRKKTTKSKLRASANGEADVDATSTTTNSNITVIGTWAMVLFVTGNEGT